MGIDVHHPTPAADRRFLQEVIRTVSSTLDLDRVLQAIVDLLTEATQCHACYVFLADDRDQMVLSRVLRAVRGARRRDRDGAGRGARRLGRRAPRAGVHHAGRGVRSAHAVFEEFEEEKYQSVVSVPLLAKDSSVLGVVALHAEAPHDYSQRDAEFLLTSASLVAGAIENAQLHRETERRVATLEGLFALAGAISEAETLEDLLPAVTLRVVPLLGVDGCEIYLLEADGERLRLRAASPGSTAPRVIGLRDVGIALAVSRTTGRTSATRRCPTRWCRATAPTRRCCTRRWWSRASCSG